MADRAQFTIDDKTCLDPGRLGQGLANSYTCPLGSVAGDAWLLVTRETLNGLSDGWHTIKVYAGSDTLTFSKAFVIVSATAVSTGGKGAEELSNAYLVHLRDKRHVLAMSVANVRYNVRCPAPPGDSGATLYYTETLNAGAVWTWATILADLWALLPTSVAGSAPTLTYTPTGTPEGLQFLGVSAWESIATLLAKLASALVFNPITGNCSIVKLGVSQQNLDSTLAGNKNRLLSDDSAVEQNAARIPEKFRVFFPTLMVDYGSEASTPRTSNFMSNSVYKVDVASGVSGAIAGTVFPLWDDRPAMLNFDGTLATGESTALTAKATEVANNWLAEIKTSDTQFARTYGGALSTPLPGSQIKSVTWRDYGDSDGLCTDYERSPGVASESTGGGSSSSAGLAERLRPPDFARVTHPMYPPLVHVLQIVGSGSDGDPVSPDATTGLWEGKIVRVDPTHDFSSTSTYSSGATTNEPYSKTDDCWVAAIDYAGGSTEASASTLTRGDRFLGRLVGSKKVSSDGRPIFVIDAGSSQVRFGKATENWRIGDTVVVNPMLADGTITAEEVTVSFQNCNGLSSAGAGFPAADFNANVIEGQVIAYVAARMQQIDGSTADGFICVSPEAYDQRIGAIKFSTNSYVPGQGWGLMDGVANAGGNGGSGVDITDRFIIGGWSGVDRGAASHTHPVPATATAGVKVTANAAGVEVAALNHTHTTDTATLAGPVPWSPLNRGLDLYERLDNSA